MIKKILGYLFYLLGVLFIMSFIGGVFSWFQMPSDVAGIEKAERIFAIILAGVLVKVFFKYANKWTSNKELNEIK